MEPGETIEAPKTGMRVTCRESAASSGAGTGVDAVIGARSLS
jgi:hypothetical protein